MTLIEIFLLGLAAKTVLGKKSAAQSVPAAGAALAVATAPSPYGPSPSLPSSKDPYKRPPTRVHGGDSWGRAERERMAVLHAQGMVMDADFISDQDSLLEEAYGFRAKAAEAMPLTAGAPSEALARKNRQAQRAIQREKMAEHRARQIAMDLAENDVERASDELVEAYKYSQDSRHQADVSKDAALAARSRAVEAMDDVRVRRENAARSHRHGKDLARSIRRTVDPNLDMALQDERRPQMGSGFAQRPDMPFLEGQPVSLREGNFDQSQVMAADAFDNHLTANHLYAGGKRDWPQAVQQKNPNSDFSGVLVSEAGSPDFSHDIVYDVSEDFGGNV